MVLFTTIAPRFPSKANQIALETAVIAGASLLLALSAKISVPLYPVPLTLQTLVVIGLGLALGSWRSAAAVLLYLGEGAMGLPVFAGTPEKGIGLAYMMGPTGGYLIGYVIAALAAGLLASRGWDRQPLKAMAAALLSSALIYVPGLIWLGAVIGFDKPMLHYGLTPFILGDVTKALLAAITFSTIWKTLQARLGL
jgi:biotin transport system substrate-specific component